MNKYEYRGDRCLIIGKKCLRNPFPAYYYHRQLGLAYLQKEQHEKALTELKKAFQHAPEAPNVHASLAAAYSLLGRDKEARASAAKCLELAPYISVSLASKISIYKDEAFLEKVLDAMRKAGFPEGS